MSGAENVPQLKEMLEKTEMELFELKKLIQAKVSLCVGLKHQERDIRTYVCTKLH